jgi:hypothetical protein
MKELEHPDRAWQVVSARQRAAVGSRRHSGQTSERDTLDRRDKKRVKLAPV